MERELSERDDTVLDLQELLDRCMGSLEFAERILAKFQSRFDVDFAELEQAMEAQDSEAAARVAHRLKGASATAAAHGLRREAATIEQLARQQCLADIPARLQDLRHEWARFNESAAGIGSAGDVHP
jgi:HPt (histidine-containing phosphotransfer) domain-containing protein